jgi:hypothetical protein
MCRHVETFSGPIDVRQFEGNQSNPTFSVCFDIAQAGWVLVGSIIACV